MNGSGVRWITEADVVSALDLASAIDALEAALPGQIDGRALTMDKTQVVWGDGHSLHAVGGVLVPDGIVGTKTWAHVDGGATPILVLWHADGRCLAVMEAFALGQLRTAAMTALATRWLSNPGARRLALIGSGKQAFAQVAAVLAVRSIESVTVFSPTREHRETLADRLARAFPVDVVPAASARDATGDADIIVTVTRATQPVLHATDVKPGSHINAIGAISPERTELSRELVGRCDPIVVDSPHAARQLATELAGVGHLLPLAEVIETGAGPSISDLSLFKAMGLGLADIVLANVVVQRTATDVTVAAPARVAPRLGARS